MLKNKDIERLFAAAKISFKEGEADKFADDLSDMLAFIDMVHEKDAETEFNGFNDKVKDLAKNKTKNSLSHKAGGVSL